MIETTRVDLEKMKKLAQGGEYEDIFVELDKRKEKNRTGTDIIDSIQELTSFPRSECIRLMTAYLLREKKE